jgi:hypothetical protein
LRGAPLCNVLFRALLIPIWRRLKSSIQFGNPPLLVRVHVHDDPAALPDVMPATL